MVDAGELFDGLFNTYPQGAGAKIARIKEIEVQCDDLVRDIMTTLYQSFITPFDREDITEITGELDEIVDGLEGVSARLGLYDIDRVRPEAIELSRLTLRAIRRLNDAFENFSNYKRDPSVVEALIETADIEDRGDKVSRRPGQRLPREGRSHRDGQVEEPPGQDGGHPGRLQGGCKRGAGRHREERLAHGERPPRRRVRRGLLL